MILVGIFNEDELRAKKDKEAVKRKMEITGLKYSHAEMTKKGLAVYLCDIYEASYGYINKDGR